MSYEQLKLKNQICHRFYIATNGITRLYRPLLDKLEITYPQYVVLMALWEEDHIPISNIIDKTKIDGGSLSLILDKLKKKKIILTIADENDKRSKLIKLTQKGKKLKEKAKNIPEAISCQVQGLSEQEVIKLYQLLDKLNSELLTKN